MEMFAQSFKIFLLSWLLGFCHHQISMWHDVPVFRLAPGTGWISAALTTWLMSTLCMWEGRHCRRRPERRLWRAAWWMSGTTFRSETYDLYQIRLSGTIVQMYSNDKVFLTDLFVFIMKYRQIIRVLSPSTGVNAVLRHGCWSYASSPRRTAAPFHGEVSKSQSTNILLWFLSLVSVFPAI